MTTPTQKALAEVRAAIEARPTEGQWEACARGDYSDFDGDSRVILGDDMRIAVVQTNGRSETEANAELIAACNPENIALILADRDAMEKRNQELLVVLATYMDAVNLMNAAMNDGINVHGAVSGLVGATKMAERAIQSNTKG